MNSDQKFNISLLVTTVDLKTCLIFPELIFSIYERKGLNTAFSNAIVGRTFTTSTSAPTEQQWKLHKSARMPERQDKTIRKQNALYGPNIMDERFKLRKSCPTGKRDLSVASNGPRWSRQTNRPFDPTVKIQRYGGHPTQQWPTRIFCKGEGRKLWMPHEISGSPLWLPKRISLLWQFVVNKVK